MLNLHFDHNQFLK